MELLIGTGIFLATVLFVEGTYSAAKTVRRPGTKRMRKRLRTLAAGGYAATETDIVRKRVLSQVPWLHRILFAVPRIHKLDRLLEQANAPASLGLFLLVSVFLGILSFLGLSFATTAVAIQGAAALGAATLPFLWLSIRKRKRMEKFQRQLPNALDLIARSLKAGHAFSGGLRMVAEEFEDPVGTEFEKTLDQINFGVSVPEALQNLARRIDSQDLRFFVISVIVQRETGGNLAEILEKIANLIRERFELLGRVRVLSAEGKLSAGILIAIPFVIGVYFTLVRPDYIEVLFTDSLGHVMLAGAVALMCTAILLMKRIVTIKV